MIQESREAAEPSNHERWLVSYADFITLLFAFFVIMFASSQTDRQKASDSVRRAFNGEKSAPKAATTPQPQPADLHSMLGLLTTELARAISSGKLSMHMENRGLVISLQEAAYFVSGDDRVSPEGYPVLGQIGEQLEKVANPIHFEGHTDSIPIHNSRFRSNWELSSSRGIAMLEAMSTRFHPSSARMAVVSYGDAFPVASNNTAEGRARNRRVDIVILNQSGMVSLPDSMPAGGAKP